MTAPRTLPEIRARMHELADELGCPELAALAEETKRRYHGRSAPITARAVTPALAAKVRAYKAAHPDASNRTIGALFKIDGGRVSEILHGKRGEA